MDCTTKNFESLEPIEGSEVYKANIKEVFLYSFLFVLFTTYWQDCYSRWILVSLTQGNLCECLSSSKTHKQVHNMDYGSAVSMLCSFSVNSIAGILEFLHRVSSQWSLTQCFQLPISITRGWSPSKNKVNMFITQEDISALLHLLLGGNTVSVACLLIIH